MLRSLLRTAALFLLALVCVAADAEPALAPVPAATLTVNGNEAAGDSGSFTIDFNGFVETVRYGQFSNPASLASALAAMFTRDFIGMGLYAKAGANHNADLNVITFQLASGVFGPLNIAGPGTSFSFSASGFANSSATMADKGMATLLFDGTAIATVNYDDGSTGASIAQDLALSAKSPYVTVTAEGQNLYLKSRRTGVYADGYSVIFSTSTSFSSVPLSGTLSSASGVPSPVTVYSYNAIYDSAGNVQGLADSVMGMWAYGYDSLNRLTSGVASSSGGPYAGQSACWSYDNFGNRLSESVSATPCGNSPPALYAATYSADNRIAAVSAPANLTVQYDGAGNVINDGYNSYVYDAEGRICAVNGPQGMVGYQYDADGVRVGKGMLQSMSCDTSPSNYTPTTEYVLDLAGGQMTEVAVGGSARNWVHTNVTAGGMLIATYDTTGSGLHFHLSDALGSRRVQTDAAGFPEQTCQSLPFGDQLYCTASLTGPTEHHFTGKERDTESGNDYFGARYYSPNMGRFSSPDDPTGIYSDPKNPQSWNLYSYVQNNPLRNVDPDGHDCIHINNDTGAYEGTDRGDCDNSTEDKANTGHYVDGTVDTINENRSGQVTGFSGTSYDSGNLLTGAFATPLAYGPLEGPENLAAADMIGNGGMQAIGVFTAGSVVLGTAGGVGLATGVIGGGSAALSTSNITAALRFYGAQNAWKLINAGGAFTVGLSNFFKTGALPEGVTMEALRGYLELARSIVQMGTEGGWPQGGVDEQARRVAMIVQQLGT